MGTEGEEEEEIRGRRVQQQSKKMMSEEDEKKARSKGGDEVSQLIQIMDDIYSASSLLSQNKDKDICLKYLRSGSCTPRCKFNHPLVSRPKSQAPKDSIYDLIYLVERTSSLMKVVGHEASSKVVDVIQSLSKLLEKEFNGHMEILERRYGDVCYLYDECCLRVLKEMKSFSIRRPTSKSSVRKARDDTPPLTQLSPVFGECSLKIKALQEKFNVIEEQFFHKTEQAISQHTISSTFFKSLSRSLSEHAEVEHTRRAAYEPQRTAIMNKLTAALTTIWGSKDKRKKFTISPCGFSYTTLSINASIYPLHFAVSTALVPNSLTREQAVEAISDAVEKHGFRIMSNKASINTQGLTVIMSENEKQEIHIYVNDALVTMTSSLMSLYSNEHCLVRPLVQAILQWAVSRGCCSPDNATLTMYGWTILVLYFLRQSGISIRNPVHITREKNNPPSEALAADASKDCSLGSLLLRFFLFYGTCSSLGFQPFHGIVSIRNDKKIFRKGSYFESNNQLESPLVTASDVICSLKSDGVDSSPDFVSESECDNDDFLSLDEDNTDKELSSNNSGRSLRRRHRMVVQSSDIPGWRFCIENPLEESDLASVIYARSGQAHIMTELRRSLLLYHKMTSVAGGSDPNPNFDNNYWRELCTKIENAPLAIKTCSICGQQGHTQVFCEYLCCYMCKKTGHFARDCLLNFCSNCRKQGHLAKDCHHPKLCRNCKQSGHLVKNCPHATCQKCGFQGSKGARCACRGVPKSGKLHRRDTTRDKSTSVMANKILSHQARSRADSSDFEANSVDSRSSGGSSRSSRRKKRFLHSHCQSNASHLRHEQKPSSNESKPAPGATSTASGSSRMQPWFPRPHGLHISVQRYSGMYSNSPLSSPFSSPRGSPVAPGKRDGRKRRPQMKAPSHQHVGAKMSSSRPPNATIAHSSGNGSASNTPRSRARTGSVGSTYGAGYFSDGGDISAESFQNTRAGTASLPPTADSKEAVPLAAGKGLAAKDQHVALQRKRLPAGGAKNDSRERVYIPRSPPHPQHDSKLSSSGGGVGRHSHVSKGKHFTTPYVDGIASRQSSPEFYEPRPPEQKPSYPGRFQSKKEKKRSFRKIQAKRMQVKQTSYVEDGFVGGEGAYVAQDVRDIKYAHDARSDKPSVHEWDKISKQGFADSLPYYDVAEGKGQEVVRSSLEYLE